MNDFDRAVSMAYLICFKINDKSNVLTFFYHWKIWKSKINNQKVTQTKQTEDFKNNVRAGYAVCIVSMEIINVCLRQHATEFNEI